MVDAWKLYVKWAVVIAIITALSFGIGYNWGLHRGSAVCFESSQIEDSPGIASSGVSTSTIAVYVVGEVAKPGVYYLPAGSRIVDAIRLAGGLTASADMASINMAMKLSDGMQIYVAPVGGLQGTGGVPSGDGKIHINVASADELESLPGIGPVLAKRIIEYRETHGPFQRVEDLLNVSGIGEKRLEQIRPYIAVP